MNLLRRFKIVSEGVRRAEAGIFEEERHFVGADQRFDTEGGVNRKKTVNGGRGAAEIGCGQ